MTHTDLTTETVDSAEDANGLVMKTTIRRWIESPTGKPGTEIIRADQRDLYKTLYVFDNATCAITEWNFGQKPGGNNSFRSIDVQVICEYGYQYELFAGLARKPGSDDWRWFASAYKHPFKPPTEFCEEFFDDIHGNPREWQRPAMAEDIKKMCLRFKNVVERHPSLLFNPSNWAGRHPRHGGFVQSIEKMLHGYFLEDWTE